MKDVYTLTEAGKLCGLHRNTTSRMFDAGELKGWRVPNSRHRRVSRAELLKFMERHGIPADRMAGAGRREG